MTLNLLKARAARLAQGAVAEQIEHSARNSRSDRIDRLVKLSIPEADRRASEERANEENVLQRLGELKREEKSCDGSRAMLDGIASRRRELEFARDQARDAATLQADTARAFREELARLEAEENRDATIQKLQVLEERGIAVIDSLVNHFFVYVNSRAEFDRIMIAIGSGEFAGLDPGAAQGRLRARFDAARVAINNDGRLPRGAVISF